ncbi:hypothetical protein WJX75_001639 [Coccomyxa subellipsoidea]|uniref:Uncharacterized protein n=1 Tax=Coccomyxa subellipsoidea TaxID=248742 RepID=A0ABR2YKN0_9CHLO
MPFCRFLSSPNGAKRSLNRQIADDTAKRDPEATLKLVGDMRREDYAVGVLFLALGLGAANTVTQAITSVGQKGVQALGKAGSVLDEQQKSSADRAKQWLSGLAQQGEKQAAIAQESLEEWPDLLQQSLDGAVESHNQAVQQAQANVQQWAETYVPGSADVQRLWHSAAEAARTHIAQALSTGKGSTDGGAQLSSSPARSASTGAVGSTTRKQQASESTAPDVRRRSDTEVYAAESLAAARAAEARWNERIRNAYANVAANTPFWSSNSGAVQQEEKPVSHALSYARGGSTTLSKPDFAPLSSGNRSLNNSGGGISGGNSGSGGGGSGGDDSEDEQPEQQHKFLWGRLLLLASAAAAAVEQLLERPGRRGRLLVVLALLGALLWRGQKMQNRQPGRRARRSLSESFTFSNAKAARVAGDLSDMSSDDEGF